MKNLIKITFVLFACTLLFTACSKDDDQDREKTLKSVVITNDEDKQTIVNYEYDSQGRLAEISQENPYTIIFKFTYMADGRVEKIRGSYGLEYIDYTFSYENDSKIPSRMKYSGAVPTYTTDILNVNNDLFWNNEDGDNFTLESINLSDNTYTSRSENSITITPFFNTQLKNGLEKQADLFIPLGLTTHSLFYMVYASLPLSHTLTEIATSEGAVFNWQYETDAAGYITKTKNGKVEYRYK